MRFASPLLVLGLVACGSSSTPVAPPAPLPEPVVLAPVDAGTPAPVAAKPAVDPCPPINAGEISDDATPSVKAASKTTEIVPWFESRGVPKAKLLAFLALYWGHSVNPTDAETYFTGSCDELTVGDKSEPALICEEGLPEGLVEEHAVMFVVRNKRPAVVLDVGLHLVALDWPDARWLDLQLEVKDPSTVVLRDRAPDGSTLVSPPSECKAHEAVLDQCEKDWPSEPNHESYAQPTNQHGGEALRFFHDSCPLERGPNHELRIRRAPFSQAGMSMYPAKVHDCAGGRTAMVRAGKESAPGRDRAEWLRELVFYDKSCSQRGNYVWKNDRFLRDAPMTAPLPRPLRNGSSM